MEIWKDIKGYEGLYQVSDQGRVRSLRNDNKILKPCNNAFGFHSVLLSNKGKKKTKSIQRLVAETFIDNPDNCRYISYINGVQNDNRVENLKWRKKKTGGSRMLIFSKEEVLEIRKLLQEGKTQLSVSRMYEVAFSTIANIYHNRTYTEPEYYPEDK